MWLLKSPWSNPIKHLIPYLQDDQKAADYLRPLRWPDGIQGPRCGSNAVAPRERCDNGLQRFNCVHCAVRLGQQCAMFTDWTSAICEASKWRPLEWLLVMGLGQLKLNATEIAATADIQERTAQRCIHDKTDQDAPAAQVYLEVLETVRTATIKPIIAAKGKVGAQCFTDEYNIYHFTKADDDHRTVNHGAGEYARRDPDGTCVHCNTMEGIWSSLPNFLDHFKGIS